LLIKKCKCKKCNHEWYPRSEKTPVQCPACKNPNWNKDEKKKSKRSEV